jgi:hypothetical protein
VAIDLHPSTSILHITNAEGIWDVHAENEVRRMHPYKNIANKKKSAIWFIRTKDI